MRYWNERTVDSRLAQSRCGEFCHVSVQASESVSVKGETVRGPEREKVCVSEEVPGSRGQGLTHSPCPGELWVNSTPLTLS